MSYFCTGAATHFRNRVFKSYNKGIYLSWVLGIFLAVRQAAGMYPRPSGLPWCYAAQLSMSPPPPLYTWPGPRSCSSAVSRHALHAGLNEEMCFALWPGRKRACSGLSVVQQFGLSGECVETRWSHSVLCWFILWTCSCWTTSVVPLHLHWTLRLIPIYSSGLLIHSLTCVSLFWLLWSVVCVTHCSSFIFFNWVVVS